MPDKEAELPADLKLLVESHVRKELDRIIKIVGGVLAFIGIAGLLSFYNLIDSTTQKAVEKRLDDWQAEVRNKIAKVDDLIDKANRNTGLLTSYMKNIEGFQDQVDGLRPQVTDATQRLEDIKRILNTSAADVAKELTANDTFVDQVKSSLTDRLEATNAQLDELRQLASRNRSDIDDATLSALRTSYRWRDDEFPIIRVDSKNGEKYLHIRNLHVGNVLTVGGKIRYLDGCDRADPEDMWDN
ncbi:MAG: hypothetical protein R3E01_10150 [Pirellulaceae bacterium]